jgi:dihydroxyacetone kinase-like predicted kinase
MGSVDVNVKEINERIENIHRYLNKHKEQLNRLNVFPVPDGDTGLNMVLTIQGAMSTMKNLEEGSMPPGAYIKSFADQMLLNSRGCSGVILSLFVQGFAEVVENSDFSKENILKAIERGYQNAYEGTENPREGTMLTLMKAFKEKYAELMPQQDDPIEIFKQTVPYLKEVLSKTPDMLPVLKQAGVVDSGGAGFIFVIQGVCREFQHNGFANGLPVPTILNLGRSIRLHLNLRLKRSRRNILAPLIQNVDLSGIHNTRLQEILQNVRKISSNIRNNHTGNRQGKELEQAIMDDLASMDSTWNPEIKQKYCTEFVLETAKDLTKEQLRALISPLGDSLIVINAGNKYKVHIHTNKPEAVFSAVSSYGDLIFTKVDDMKKQHRNFISEDVVDYQRDKSLLCLVSGKGFAEILKQLGADDVYCYGKNKPSVNQLVKVLDGLKAKNIIVAADDSDILMALKYAVSLCKSNVYIVESSNPIDLISMLMNVSKEYDVITMFDMAMKNIHSLPFCSIARSTREVVTMKGEPVRKDDYFAVFQKKIILADSQLDRLLEKTIQELGHQAELITFYKGVPARKMKNVLEPLKEKFPGKQFEEYEGGQYNYHYYITFE